MPDIEVTYISAKCEMSIGAIINLIVKSHQTPALSRTRRQYFTLSSRVYNFTPEELGYIFIPDAILYVACENEKLFTLGDRVTAFTLEPELERMAHDINTFIPPENEV